MLVQHCRLYDVVGGGRNHWPFQSFTKLNHGASFGGIHNTSKVDVEKNQKKGKISLNEDVEDFFFLCFRFSLFFILVSSHFFFLCRGGERFMILVLFYMRL